LTRILHDSDGEFDTVPRAFRVWTPVGARRAMRSIVVVLPELLPVPPVRGGAVEHWVQEFTARVARPGRPLTVISRPAGSPGLPNVTYLGIPWTACERVCHRLKVALGRGNLLRHLAKIQNVWSYGRRAARAARGFDLVYLHNEPNLLLFLRVRPGQRIVLHMHNDHLSMRVFRLMYRRALRKVDRVVFVSDFIRRRALEIFPEYAERFAVVLNATDSSVFQSYGAAARALLEGVVRLDPRCVHILYVGRLAAIKGVHVLIEAFSEILARNPRARLIIAGSSFFDGARRTPYEAELAQLAATISSAIVFTGYLPHTSLRFLYSACDVVVVPSLWQEPFGLVVLEAMASGTCVVASAVGGVPEIIEDQRTGVLVPPGDAHALCEAICSVLADSDFKRALEERACARVAAKFTWDRLVVELEAVFAQSR
jgi:spore coat protein SA